MSGRPTGWLPDPRGEDDPRGLVGSVRAAAPVADDAPLSRATYGHEQQRRSVYQFRRNSCLGISEVHAFELVRLLLGLGEVRYSALAAYWDARALSRLEGMDGGAYMGDGITAATQLGLPLEELWPYDEDRVFDAPPLAAQVDGIQRVALDIERITEPTLEGRVRAAVRTFERNGVLWVGKQLTRAYEAHSGDGVLAPPTRGEERTGGHATIYASHDTELGGTVSLVECGSWLGWGSTRRRGICQGRVAAEWLMECHEIVAIRRVSDAP